MTVFSHLDPDFSKVFSLQAVNEPVMDASKTPGYGQCKQHTAFMHQLLIHFTASPNRFCAHHPCRGARSWYPSQGHTRLRCTNLQSFPEQHCHNSSSCGTPSRHQSGCQRGYIGIDKPADGDGLEIQRPRSQQLCWNSATVPCLQVRTTMFIPAIQMLNVPSFMDIGWQYNEPSNPADAALGPQAYDNHLYYSFGVSL
jgi:glucan endo-1,6-beta-glucosidase